ncbi:MAG: hypothetical protein IKO49_07670 [Bacilli bacterium]|nr:hypothetical protein [Bacilli bacterium]
MANTKKSGTSSSTKKKVTTNSKVSSPKKKTTVSNKTATAKKTTTAKKVASTKSTTAKKSTSSKSAKPKTSTKKSAGTTASKKNSSVTVKKEDASKNKKQVVKPEKQLKKEEVKTQEEKIKKEEKKLTSNNNLFTIIGISILVVAIIVSCIVSTSKGRYNNTSSSNSDSNSYTGSGVAEESASIKDSEKKDLTSINIDQYLEILAGDEAKVIYIARPTCSHCAVQKPIMENLVYKYNITINYLNTDELDSDGISRLQESNEYFSGGWGTPLILIVKNNEILNKASGETSGKDLVQLFKQYGIINE